MIVGNEFLVRVVDVSKEYAFGKQTLQALKNVSMSVLRGEFLAIAGPSGSGKSTLLNLIGCIDIPTSGSIYIEGQKTTDQTLISWPICVRGKSVLSSRHSISCPCCLHSRMWNIRCFVFPWTR